MAWFFIEALVALAVGIAIVWWTMAPQRKAPRGVDAKSGDAKSGVAKPGATESGAAAKVD